MQTKTKTAPPKGKDISELMPATADPQQQILASVRENRSLDRRGDVARRRRRELLNAQ